jgi:hypothetical protein
VSDDQEPTSRNEKPDDALTGRQTYNIVSDTVTGVNVRLKDNVIQALAIVACLVLGSLIGAVVSDVRVAGAVVGGFLGLLVGWIGSGVVLMVYRAVMHIRGRHD